MGNDIKFDIEELIKYSNQYDIYTHVLPTLHYGPPLPKPVLAPIKAWYVLNGIGNHAYAVMA